MRLQALGTVNRQQPNGIGVDSRRRLQPASLEGAHKGVGRGIPAAVKLQRDVQQGAQVGQHRGPGLLGRGSGKACQHIAMVIDCLQGVVRRQTVDPTLIFDQISP